MILVCGGIKGGSGKTTLATNFAIMRALDGRDVLLVDADDQESATDFTVWRNETTHDHCGYTSIQLRDRAVLTELRKLRDKYDDIIIDTGGRDTQSQRAALTLAHVLMVPFVPRSLDVWTMEKVEALVEDIRVVNPDLQVYAFLNRADPSGAENDQARELLSESKVVAYVDCPLGYRKAFGKATAQGQAVVELKPQDKKASEEITALYGCVINANTALK
jgi:chromosome partitioning protein